MKILLSTLLVASIFAFMLPATANVAEIEPFGMLSAMGGAERETGEPGTHVIRVCCGGEHRPPDVGRGGGRGTIEALGVIPFAWQSFGLQGSAQYVGGLGSRFGVSLGPIYGWDGGKTGFFVNYQGRTLREAHFFWVNPALALYFDQMNLNFSYAQPVSPAQLKHKGLAAKEVDIPANRLQGTVSYFPPMNLAFVRKDNLELTFGAQVNSFSGPEVHNIRSAGVGPVFGVAMMPWQNVEINLFRGTVDNRSRYKVDSGVRFFFGKGTPTLKEFRRKYLEAGPGPVGAFTGAHCVPRC